MTKRFFTLTIFAVTVLFASTVILSAEDIALVIKVDKSQVVLGDSVELDVTLYGTQDMPQPDLSDIKGFHANYLGPATKISIINGNVSASITHVFRLYPTSLGKLEIGPLQQGYRGQVYTSNSVTIEVFRQSLPPAAAIPETSAAEQIQEQSSFVVVEPAKKEAFVNEIIPVKVKLYLKNVGTGNIQYPPGLKTDGFSVGEFSKPDEYPNIYNGIQYEVIEFNTNIFATRSGDLSIGPARVKGTIAVPRKTRSRIDDMFGDDFFKRTFAGFESVPLDVESEQVQMKILPLPEEGKPEGFNGSMGNFTMDVDVKPLKVKLGDPITLTIKVNGKGNLTSVSPTLVSENENFKVYEPQVLSQTDSSKVFEQVVIPIKTGNIEIPKIGLAYWDVSALKYKLVEKGPFQIEVTKPDKEEQVKIVETPVAGITKMEQDMLGKDILYIKERPGKFFVRDAKLYRSGLYILFNVICTALFIFIFVFESQKARMRTDQRYARSVIYSRKAKAGMKKAGLAIARGDTKLFYDEVFKSMQAYLGDKLHLPVGGITINVVDERLTGSNVDPAELERIRNIFKDCDVARYALSELGRQNMEATFENMKRSFEYLEKVKII